MSADQQRQFPSWDVIYRQQAIETMPWFYPELDDDLGQALDRLSLRGGSALDLGTGPGTQAVHLARRGFAVTATDISEAAIRLAREKAAEQLGVDPRRCVVVEDAPAGISAGGAASLVVLALRSTHAAHQLRRAHAVIEQHTHLDVEAHPALAEAHVRLHLKAHA